MNSRKENVIGKITKILLVLFVISIAGILLIADIAFLTTGGFEYLQKYAGDKYYKVRHPNSAKRLDYLLNRHKADVEFKNKIRELSDEEFNRIEGRFFTKNTYRKSTEDLKEDTKIFKILIAEKKRREGS